MIKYIFYNIDISYIFKNTTYIFSFVFIFIFFSKLNAQKVYRTIYKSEADKIIFICEYKNEADILVYETKYKNEAKPWSGIWFWTKFKSQADWKVYFTKYKSEADLKIYFVKYKNQAGFK